MAKKPTTKPKAVIEAAEPSPSFHEALKPGGAPTKKVRKAAKAAVEKLTFDSLIVAEFTRRGFQDVRLRETTLTFRRWIEKGRVVRKGERPVCCGPLRLWHISQTEPLHR